MEELKSTAYLRQSTIEHSAPPHIDTISPALRAIALIHDIVVGDDGVVVTVDPVSSIS